MTAFPKRGSLYEKQQYFYSLVAVLVLVLAIAECDFMSDSERLTVPENGKTPELASQLENSGSLRERQII